MDKFIISLVLIFILIGCSISSLTVAPSTQDDNSIPHEVGSHSGDSDIMPVKNNSQLYSKPNSFSETLAYIPSTSEITVSSSHGEYFLVNYKGINGYIYKNNVDMNKKLRELVASELQQKKADEERKDALILQEKKIGNSNMRTQKLLEAHSVWINVSRANIRSSNTIQSDIKDLLWRGTKAFKQEESGAWARLLYSPPDLKTVFDHRGDLSSLYDHGWVQKKLISEQYIELMSNSDRRRWRYLQKHPNTSDEFKRAIESGDVILGMTRDMAIASWGEPEDVNRTVGSWGTHEQWVYSHHYLYFKNNILTSWQD